MDTLAAKLVACLLIFVVSFLCSVLPLKVHSAFQKLGQKGETLLSVLMSFGGGVFLGTFLFHMMPEARMLLEYFWLKKKGIDYPMSELIIGIGFFAIFIMDHIIHQWTSNYSEFQNENLPLCEHKARKNTTKSYTEDSLETKETLAKETKEETENKDISANEDKTQENTDKPGAGAAPPVASPALPSEVHSARALVLLVALSFHRLFEGVSLGLQVTNSYLFSLTLAIICHESVVGFSLGLKLVQNNWTTRRVILACCMCCLVQTVGCLIGIGLSEGTTESAELQIASGVLQSIATGTFIYITFFEILIGHVSSALEIAAVGVGMAAMAGLATLDSCSMTVRIRRDMAGTG